MTGLYKDCTRSSEERVTCLYTSRLRMFWNPFGICGMFEKPAELSTRSQEKVIYYAVLRCFQTKE